MDRTPGVDRPETPVAGNRAGLPEISDIPWDKPSCLHRAFSLEGKEHAVLMQAIHDATEGRPGEFLAWTVEYVVLAAMPGLGADDLRKLIAHGPKKVRQHAIRELGRRG